MKYFFSVTDGEQYYSDDTGQVFRNDASALDHAALIAKDLADKVEYRGFVIVIVGNHGLEVARVPVSAESGPPTDSVGEGSY